MKAFNGRPLVTFALFAYNQEQYIRQAVEGAFAQTYEPLEIILSDDCSSDGTFETMQEMVSAYTGPHTVRLRRNTSNLGMASHINALLDNASGEYVSWAAGDDIAMAEKIEILIAPALADSQVVGVHSRFIKVDLQGKVLPTKERSFAKKHPSLDQVINDCASVISQSHLFKTEVFRRFGPFRADLMNEGPSITFRELCTGSISYIDTPLTQYRIGSGVSTYRGGDRQRLKSTEPLKVTKWRLSTYQQILDDLPKTNLIGAYEDRVRRKIRFYENLLKVNMGQASLKALVQNTFYEPGDLSTIRAILRTGLPTPIYSLLVRLKLALRGNGS